MTPTPEALADAAWLEKQGWRPAKTAPTSGDEFLALLSNGWRVILYASDAIRRKSRYAWWGGGSFCSRVSVPYEPSHSLDSNWDMTVRLVGWMPLPEAPTPPDSHDAP